MRSFPHAWPLRFPTRQAPRGHHVRMERSVGSHECLRDKTAVSSQEEESEIMEEG